MARVERFEDLVAWQKASEVTREIYQVTREGAFAKAYGLSNQIQRAAVSIMSNTAEGFERSGTNERLQFCAVAKAYPAEVRSQLYVALDVSYLSQYEFETLLAKSEEVARLLGRLRQSLIERRDRDDG